MTTILLTAAWIITLVLLWIERRRNALLHKHLTDLGSRLTSTSIRGGGRN